MFHSSSIAAASVPWHPLAVAAVVGAVAAVAVASLFAIATQFEQDLREVMSEVYED